MAETEMEIEGTEDEEDQSEDDFLSDEEEE